MYLIKVAINFLVFVNEKIAKKQRLVTGLSDNIKKVTIISCKYKNVTK